MVHLGCRSATVEESLPIAVQVTTVKRQEFASEMRYSATVKELQKVDLSFKIAGTVQELYQVHEAASGRTRDVQVGDAVPSGAVLAELDDADIRRKLKRRGSGWPRRRVSVSRPSRMRSWLRRSWCGGRS